LQAHCQSPTIQHADQSFVKELAKPTQEKIVFKKFPTLQKKIKTQRTADTTMTHKLNKDNCLRTRKTEHQLPTAVLQKWRVSASYDSEVVNQNLVLRMKFSGENRHLRVAAKRYLPF
jgi:hypothetical protein